MLHHLVFPEPVVVCERLAAPVADAVFDARVLPQVALQVRLVAERALTVWALAAVPTGSVLAENVP